MPQQQTLAEAVSFSGIGLHSGNRVTMTFHPAPPNTGIRFRRVDLDGQPEIEALADNVGATSRSTTLVKGNIKIQTVEHVLATFAGYEVDNAVVELDANEPPIADGSAREYCRMIETAGLVPQAAEREPLVIESPIEFQGGDTLIGLFPHEGLRISCTSADKAGRFTQFLSLEITPETWARDIAHARTFCFFEEIEYLIKHGLIKGGSLENAVVIREDAVLTNEPLRYPDEFVRHKILDLLGDLSLVGRPLRAHVVAVRPSHSANCELARMLRDRIRQQQAALQTFTPPPAPQMPAPSPTQELTPEQQALRESASLDILQLLEVLPHRYPFLMVDRVLSIEGNRVRAVKNVSVNEPYFQGHFPRHPIMPGVLQLEAIAQVAGILMLRQAEHFNKVAYFMSAEKVKWRKPVRPGDQLIIDVEVLKARGRVGRAKGVCLVNDEPVSEAEVTFMLIDR